MYVVEQADKMTTTYKLNKIKDIIQYDDISKKLYGNHPFFYGCKHIHTQTHIHVLPT